MEVCSTSSDIHRLALCLSWPAVSLGSGIPRALHSESTWSARPSPAHRERGEGGNIAHRERGREVILLTGRGGGT